MTYNKYGAKKTFYNGVKYDSKLEATYAENLDWRLKAKDIKSWERQVKISLDVNNIHICNYFMDFVITHINGKKEYIETKGFENSTWKLKWKLFNALFKNKDIIITLVKS